MADQAPVQSSAPAEAPTAQTLPDRTQNAADGDAHPQGEISKNAAKKAAKMAKMNAEKADKAANKGIGKSEAKKPTSKPTKGKIAGAALIGIDVAKEEDFSGWYQQVLLKGDMLDYYDVSGCFILKVSVPKPSSIASIADSAARFIFRVGGDPAMVQYAYQEDGGQELLVSALRLGRCLAEGEGSH